MPHRPVLNRTYWVGFALLFFAVALPAYADPVLDTIGNTYKDASGGWGSTLAPLATSLFTKLALIELVWSGIWWLLERDDPNQILVALLRKIMPLMFFFAILQNFDTWIPAVIDGFSDAGQKAAHISALTPSSVMDRGLEVATTIASAAANIGLFSKDVGKVIMAGLAALGVLLCFAVIAGQMLVTLIESYIVVSGGVLFLGFAGSRWTTTFAEKYLSYAVSVGVKLFVTYLIIGTGQHVSDTWAAMISNEMLVQDYLIIFGGALVYMFLAWQIPSMASSMMSGAVSMTLGSAAATAATMAAGVAGAAGIGQKALASGAGNLMSAAEVGGAAINRAKAGGASNFATVTAGAAGHLAAAGAQAIGDSIRGLGDNTTGRNLAGRLNEGAAAAREQRAAAGAGPATPEIGSALPGYSGASGSGAAAAPSAPAPSTSSASGSSAAAAPTAPAPSTSNASGSSAAAAPSAPAPSTSSASGSSAAAAPTAPAPSTSSASESSAVAAPAEPVPSTSDASESSAAVAPSAPVPSTSDASESSAAAEQAAPVPSTISASESSAVAAQAASAQASAPTAGAASASTPDPAANTVADAAASTSSPAAPGAETPLPPASQAPIPEAPAAPAANNGKKKDDEKKDNRNAMQKLAEHVETLGKMPNDSAAGAGVQITLKHD